MSIRPRLIDQEVGFTLTYNDTVYELKKSATSTDEFDTISFNQYLTGVLNKDSSFSGIITALRAYRDALVARWGE